MVKTEVFAVESVMLTGVGLNEVVVSLDWPPTLKVTFPVKPPEGVIVIVYVVPLPGLTVCDGGLALTEKSAIGRALESFAMNASLAPPAFAACNGANVGKLVEAV